MDSVIFKATGKSLPHNMLLNINRTAQNTVDINNPLLVIHLVEHQILLHDQTPVLPIRLTDFRG